MTRACDGLTFRSGKKEWQEMNPGSIKALLLFNLIGRTITLGEKVKLLVSFQAAEYYQEV